MDQGKLTNHDLKELVLDRIVHTRKEVVLGPKIGEDCCAISAGDPLVLSTDPITAADANAGFLALHVNANDVAAGGAVPFAALVTLLIPESATKEQVVQITDELAEEAARMNVDIIGGHTEVTAAVRRPVVALTMLGKPVVDGRLVTTSGMKDGDTLIMTKYAGIEGTLILAEDHKNEIADVLTEEDREQLKLLKGFLSVVPEGVIGAEDLHVHGMHDITEGGVIGAVLEMSEASEIGAELDLGKVPVLPVTKKLCDHFHIDVYRLISSGSMLMAVGDQSRVMEELAKAGIAATIIGKARSKSGVMDKSTGLELRAQAADELYKTEKL